MSFLTVGSWSHLMLVNAVFPSRCAKVFGLFDRIADPDSFATVFETAENSEESRRTLRKIGTVRKIGTGQQSRYLCYASSLPYPLCDLWFLRASAVFSGS